MRESDDEHTKLFNLKIIALFSGYEKPLESNISIYISLL